MRTRPLSAICLPVAVLASCAGTDVSTTPWLSAPDTHSYARPAEVRSTHLDLMLDLDFEARVATGHVVHHLERVDRAAP
ncbi:MAG: hypothetical protein KAI24_01465, partial [Planctomycetes bacterium]|nr:hypothetical protein [Planctomycetota bacterium]